LTRRRAHSYNVSESANRAKARLRDSRLTVGPGNAAEMTTLTQRGFTLIELLVVIAILAVLLAVMAPSLQRARDLARLSACGMNLRRMGVAGAQYANNNEGYLAYNSKTGENGWSHFTFIAKWYNPATALVNMGNWVYFAYIHGSQLYCPDQTAYNPASDMAPEDDNWQTTIRWAHDYPQKLDGSGMWTEWVYSTYAFNAGLTAGTWYTTRPWTRTNSYTGDMEPWRLQQMEPNWPIVADLRMQQGTFGPCPYPRQPKNGNHNCDGYSVLYADQSVTWVRMKDAADLSDVDTSYTSDTNTASALSPLWVVFMDK